jgi:hypothetical protein
MYFATILKTTAPVKLPISQLSLFSVRNYKVNINPTKATRSSTIRQSTSLITISRGCSRSTWWLTTVEVARVFPSPIKYRVSAPGFQFHWASCRDSEAIITRGILTLNIFKCNVSLKITLDSIFTNYLISFNPYSL